jgi:hypothetical protein
MTDRPAPSGNGKPTELLTIITHPLQFKDGSRIRIVVEALKGHNWDEATRASYNVLFPILNDLEQDATDVSD